MSRSQWDNYCLIVPPVPLLQGDAYAKYYSHTMQVQYDVHTLHSNNLYQIYTYVKNFDKERTGNVAGMLLYARTDEDVLPHNSYKMGGNRISVDTLNLDCEFDEIKNKLNSIVVDNLI